MLHTHMVFFLLTAVCFLEFWKRQQTSLQYDWDVAQYELEEVLFGIYHSTNHMACYVIHVLIVIPDHATRVSIRR